MRGHTATAAEILEHLPRLSGTEDNQEKAYVAMIRAFISAGLDRPSETLDHVRGVLKYDRTIPIRHEAIVFAWPLAAAAAHALCDQEATNDLLAFLDYHPVGHLPPLLRAERMLTGARLLAARAHPDANTALTDAVAAVRQAGSPYHLALALLDQAIHLYWVGDIDGATAAVTEARNIAVGLDAPAITRRVDAVASGAAIRTS